MLVDSGTLSNVDLGTLTQLVSVAAPTSDAKQYVLVAKFSSLGTSHNLVFKEVGEITVDSDPLANGQAADIAYLDFICRSGEPNHVVHVWDSAAASPAATIKWALYDTTPGQATGGGTGDEVWTSQEKTDLIAAIRRINRTAFFNLLKSLGITTNLSDVQDVSDFLG